MQILPNNLQTSLPSLTKRMIPINIFWMIFVKTVIREMNVWIFEILFCWFLIIFSTESDQPLLIQIADVGINWGNHDIESEIKFFILQQQRVINIRLNYPLSWSYFWYVAHFFNQNNAVTLATCWRFRDVCSTFGIDNFG